MQPFNFRSSQVRPEGWENQRGQQESCNQPLPSGDHLSRVQSEAEGPTRPVCGLQCRGGRARWAGHLGSLPGDAAEEEDSSDGTGRHALAGCQTKAWHLPCQPLSFLYLKGNGQQAEGGRETEKQNAGRQLPFDLRQGKYLFKHS